MQVFKGPLGMGDSDKGCLFLRADAAPVLRCKVQQTELNMGLNIYSSIWPDTFAQHTTYTTVLDDPKSSLILGSRKFNPI